MILVLISSRYISCLGSKGRKYIDNNHPAFHTRPPLVSVSSSYLYLLRWSPLMMCANMNLFFLSKLLLILFVIATESQPRQLVLTICGLELGVCVLVGENKKYKPYTSSIQL